MRLTQYEVKSIKESFKKAFNDGQIYLFGSRVDDNQKGGDIDLYIVPANVVDLRKKKIDFLVDLKSKIGFQKIDAVISSGKDRLIDKEAMEKGVML